MSTPTPTAPSDSQQPPAPGASATQDKRRQRLLSYSTKNMIYSLLAVLALSFVLWAFIPSEGAVQRRPADVVPAADFVAEQAGYQVYAPAGLDDSWTVTTARLTPIAGQETWRVGAMHDDRTMVALSQTLEPSQAWLDTFIDGTGALGEQPLDGPDGVQDWTMYQGERGLVLVLEPQGDQEATTVIHGNATPDLVAEFVGQLQIVQP